MKRPKSVKVFGYTFPVAYVPSIDEGKARGMAYLNDQRIEIEEGQAPLLERDTLLHEVLHVIWDRLHLGLSDQTEERIVSALATALVGVLQDNPQFARWLIEPVP